MLIINNNNNTSVNPGDMAVIKKIYVIETYIVKVQIIKLNISQ